MRHRTDHMWAGDGLAPPAVGTAQAECAWAVAA